MKAFTLLETLITLAIISAMMGLGIVALTRFQQQVELENNYSDMVSNVKLVQNKARNSSVSDTKRAGSSDPRAGLVDIYGIKFNADYTYEAVYCDKLPAGESYQCFSEPSFFTPAITENIQISSSCNVLGFERITADIISLNPGGDKIDEGECEIAVENIRINKSKTIQINLEVNNIDIQ